MRNLSIIREEGIVGYNDKLLPEFLPRKYVADLLNATVSADVIKKRTGFTAQGNDTGDKPILGLWGISTSAGVNRLYQFHANAGSTAIEIYEWTGSGNWTLLNDALLTNVTGHVHVVVAEGVLYAYDGSSTPVKITPGSPSTVAAVSDVNHPKGKFGVWFHNFQFVAGVSGNLNRLYWSDLGDSDDFTDGVTGFLDINPNDGDKIDGLEALNNELLIFKKDTVWSLTGFGTSTFTVSNMNERVTGIGTVSHMSVVNTGNDVYYLSDAGGTPEFRSLQKTRYGTIIEMGVISDEIKGTMDGLNKSKLGNVSGIFDGRKIYWSLPQSASTVNNLVLVYDTFTKGWVRWTGFSAAYWAQTDFGGSKAVYFGNAGNDSKIYKLDNSTSDNGATINFQITTRRYGAEDPELKKKYKWIYIGAQEVGNYDVTIDKSVDGFTYDNLGTLNLSGTGAAFDNIILDTSKLGGTDFKYKRFSIGKSRNRYIQFKFHDTSATSTVNIKNWELLYIKKKAPLDS